MWSDDLTDEETDVLIDKAASEIARAPFVVPFFGFDFVNDYGRLFQKRDNVEKLLQRIEQTTKKPAAKD